MSDSSPSEPTRKFQVRVRTKVSLSNNNSPVSTPTTNGAITIGGGGSGSGDGAFGNNGGGTTPTNNTLSSSPVTSLSSSPATPTSSSSVTIAKRPIQRRTSTQPCEPNTAGTNNGERRGNVVVIGRKSLNSLQNSVGSHSERIIQNAMSLQKRTSLHSLSSSPTTNATTNTTTITRPANKTRDNTSSNPSVLTSDDDNNNNNTKEEETPLDSTSTPAVDTTSNAANDNISNDGYDTESVDIVDDNNNNIQNQSENQSYSPSPTTPSDASPTIEDTSSTTESAAPELALIRERRMQRVRSMANVIRTMGSQLVQDNKLQLSPDNWKPFKSTLPQLSNTEILGLYEEFPNENEFYFKNALYSETEAKNPQILMTSAEIQIYNGVVRDLATNGKPEYLMNHIIFEHWDVVVHARKRFDTDNIVKRLGKGVDGVDTRRKVNPENDELIYIDSAVPADGINKSIHNISKCSKSWKYQLKQWEDRLGYLSMQDTPLESVNLLRPTYPWMKELANYNRMTPI